MRIKDRNKQIVYHDFRNTWIGDWETEAHTWLQMMIMDGISVIDLT